MKKGLVYIKTRDGGTTSLVGGTRVSETHIRLETYDTVDELNSHLGFLTTFLSGEHDKLFLQKIQGRLFAIGPYFAIDRKRTRLKEASITIPERVKTIEHETSRLDDTLPPLSAFALPGRCRGAAVYHICYTVCRCTKRHIPTLAERTDISSELLAYVNRLSDYLFVFSREMN